MSWYAVYTTSTGALVSVGTVVADPLDGSLTAKELSGQPNFSTHHWDTGTKDFVITTPSTVMGKSSFLDRFTLTEKKRLSLIDDLQASDKTKRDVKSFLNFLQIVESVDKADSFIISALITMEGCGIIGTGRKSEILA